ncbi:Hypothetical protein D9617_32g092010 [Elsinoe fawcettii]|nr:Hypothetical protein D9617_32g092010 [Elsinoe fawcettii]
MEHTTYPSANKHFALFITISVVVQIIATSALAARLYVRTKITRTLANDDWLLIFSQVTSITATGIWLDNRVKSVNYMPASLELFEALIARYWVAISLYITAGITAKIAIAIFFLRLAIRPKDRYTILIPLGVYITALSVSMTIILFRCGLPLNPIRILRDESCLIGPHVIRPLSYLIAVLGSLCDLTFSMVPIHLLRKARSMTCISKASVCFVILLANVATIVSITKLPFVEGASLGPNSFQDGAAIFIISVIETAVSVTAISLACLKPLLKVFGIGSSAPNSTSPDATPEIPERASDPVKSSILSRIKSLQIDVKVLGGIGILPNSTVTSTVQLASIDNVLDETGGKGDKQPHPQWSNTLTKGGISISEVLHNDGHSQQQGTGSIARETEYVPRSTELFHTWSTTYLIAFILYVLSGALVKIVIASFFIKIALYPWQRVLIIGPVCAYLITLIVGVNLIMFRCRLPLDSTRILSDGECPIKSKSIIKLGIAVATINCICDWIFAVIPLQMLHAAKGLNRASRISAGCVIGLAVIGSTVSVVRLPFFSMLSFTPLFFERCPVSFILSLIETTVAVLAISLATLKPLLKVIRLGSSARRSTTIQEGVVSPPRGFSVHPDADLFQTEKSSQNKTLRFDSRAMVGIGILPHITLSTRAEDEEEVQDDYEDEEDVEMVRVQMPKIYVPRRLASQMSLPSIGQVLDSEMGVAEVARVKDDEGGNL